MNTGIGKDRVMKINQLGRALLFSSVAVAAFSSGAAFAQCSLAAWDASAGTPGASELGNPRYVGECGFEPAAVGQYVQDNITEAAVTDYIVSFYALTKFNAGSTASNTVTVFEALSSGTEVLDLTVRGDNTAVLTSGGNTTSPVAINTGTNYNGWNHYKITWTSGGATSLAVNGGTPASITGIAGTLTEARLGHVASSSPNLQSGGLAVDQFVSLREDDATQTDPLCPGDSQGDDDVDVFDALQAYNDATTTIVGQPDYQGDGDVDVFDALAIYANPGLCP